MKHLGNPVHLAWTALAVLGLTLLARPVAAQSPAPCDTGFLHGQVDSDGQTMLYVVYVPRDYTPDKQWPVILFLHGGGTAGDDGFYPVFSTLPLQGPYPDPIASKRTVAGSLGVAVMRYPQRFPCLVVFPQQRSGNEWVGHKQAQALQALEQVVVKYNGDRSRLYLTGLSGGGHGTWKMASDYPDLFAAIIPISGRIDGLGSPATMAPRLKSLPTWVFHGDRDSFNSVQSSREMVAAIRAAGNPNIRYTEYPGVDHNAWDPAYNDPEVIEWLLAQKR